MSRFADSLAVEVVELPGPCRCGPNSTHARCSATRRKQLGQGIRASALEAGLRAGGGALNPIATRIALVSLAFTGWNFLGPDGTPMPFTPDNVALLDETTLAFLAENADSAILEGDPLPNASDAPSQTSSPVSASDTPTDSPTPATPTPATPTTS